MSPILITETDLYVTDFLKQELHSHGFQTIFAKTGRETILLSQNNNFSLLILELELPDLDGIKVLEKIKQQNSTLPVLVLTTLMNPEAVVSALTRGADDYVTKPFSSKELLARIRVRLRKNKTNRVRKNKQMTLEAKNVRLNILTRQAWVGENVVELSNYEFRMAEIFLCHPMQVISREQLLNSIWGYYFSPGTNIVDVYVMHLRRKLGNTFIETVRGVGYRLRA
jgi:DNA-binding response OmpR family regulator